MREVRLQGASLLRRGLAAALDAAPALGAAALPYALGLWDGDAFIPPDQAAAFLPDHLLALLAHRPLAFAQPFIVAVAVGLLWHFAWLYFARGLTPGLRLLGLGVVDRYGDAPGAATCALRALGHALSAAALGLGWLWVFASPTRRSWADALSRSHVVRR